MLEGSVGLSTLNKNKPISCPEHFTISHVCKYQHIPTDRDLWNIRASKIHRTLMADLEAPELWKVRSVCLGWTRPNVSHFWGLKSSSIEVWGSQTASIKVLESQTQHKNNCFLVKAKFELFFRQTSLHQNGKYRGVGWVSLYGNKSGALGVLVWCRNYDNDFGSVLTLPVGWKYIAFCLK